MKNTKLVIASVTLFLLIMAQCSPRVSYPTELDKLVNGASLVFRGKIVVLHTVTTDEEDVSDTGVVSVLDVINAPASFRPISGSQVTVHFTDISKVRVGEERIFFAEPYWIGESLGVREKGSIAKSNKLYYSKEISSFIALARSKQEDERLKGFMKTSALIITGKVLNTAVPEGYRRTATEHDPDWREAEVEIDGFLKGEVNGKTVRILFSSSRDVMFHASPKLKSGDEGIFITHPTDTLMAKRLRSQYMILDKSGFIRGKEGVSRIRSLLN